MRQERPEERGSRVQPSRRGIARRRPATDARETEAHVSETDTAIATAVAQELRAPVFGISSAAQMLRMRAGEDPVVQRHLGRILREVERINRVTTELSEYGRVHDPMRVLGDPDAIWHDVLANQRAALAQQEHHVQWHRAERPPQCAIDPDQMHLALTQMLLHSADAAPRGTPLTMHSTVLPSGAWRLTLSHSGPALTDEQRAHAFDLFPAAKAGMATIGLALCRRVIEGHQGTIALTTTVEHDTPLTTVTVELPHLSN